MHRFALRRFVLLLLAGLCPGLALAASDTFEGQLIPADHDAPISIVLQMEDLGGILTGRIITSYPLKGIASFDSGRNVAGYCNLSGALSSSLTLRLYGDCSPTSFEGKYTLYYTDPKKIVRGTFRLTKKVTPSAKGKGGLASEDTSPSNVVVCIKANTRCLAACPRGDTNVEYLCSNRCRTKMQACKSKAKSDNDVE